MGWDVVLMEGSPGLLASFLALLNMYFAESASLVLQGCSSTSLNNPADVTTRFHEMARANIVRDIDEVVHQTRKFLPLIRGDAVPGGPRGAGSFLDWLRLEVGVNEARNEQKDNSSHMENVK